MTSTKNRFDLNELAGAFGDLGTLIPFVAEHCRRAVFCWTYRFDTAVIEREHPAVVIQEIVERQLLEPVPARLAPR